MAFGTCKWAGAPAAEWMHTALFFIFCAECVCPLSDRHASVLGGRPRPITPSLTPLGPCWWPGPDSPAVPWLGPGHQPKAGLAPSDHTGMTWMMTAAAAAATARRRGHPTCVIMSPIQWCCLSYYGDLDSDPRSQIVGSIFSSWKWDQWEDFRTLRKFKPMFKRIASFNE